MSYRLTNSTRPLLRSLPSSTSSAPRRSLFGFGKKKASALKQQYIPLISQDNLFHPLSQSPFKEIQAKGERIKKQAFCPVSSDKYGEKVHVAFECPDCGYPTHASRERWAEDGEHGRYWPRLREANEDEHDLRSGRELTEFKLPGKSATATSQPFARSHRPLSARIPHPSEPAAQP